MKISAVVKAVSAAAVRLGVSASVQPMRVASTVYVSPMKLAYALGNFLLNISKEESVGVLSQTINHFFKRLTDQAAVADQISSQFYKSLKEDARLSDSEILVFFKGLGEQVKIEDVRTFVFNKGLNDQPSAIDRLVRVLSTKKLETASVTDVIRLSLIFSRAFVETATAQVLYSNHLNKRLSAETGFVSDSILMFISKSKSFEDLSHAVDSLFKTLSKRLADTAVVRDTIKLAVTFSRSFSESSLVADALKVSTNKGRNESAQVSDTGSLNKQNYTSEAYFAENYVGTSSSF